MPERRRAPDPNMPHAGPTLAERSAALLEALGLCKASDIDEVTPLAGGVASDIARVRFGDRVVCVKFALPTLRVAAEWRVPVRRGKAEFAWLTVARSVLPDSAPALFGWSDAAGGFAMEYVGGPDVYLWKAALLAEAPDRGEADRVARALGCIHAASARVGFDDRPFRNADDFDAIRLEPYLRFTAQKHPAVARHLMAMADRLLAKSQILVHGDVSPKNILIRQGEPVLLDAECATMGDPCFDIAFCLNHLALKAVHLPGSRAHLLGAVPRFWNAYRPFVRWEDPTALEARVASLLPMLMLARVDGKSPVEYLNADAQRLVRAHALPLIERPVARLVEVVEWIRAGTVG